MSKKISLIGAGSAVFSLNLIKDLCLTPGLQGSTVSFMDVDAARLEGAYNLCRRYAKEVGLDLKLERTLDRRECLKGADFVINTALDGGHSRLREGWRIAREHGYRFGGSLHIVHDEAFFVNFYQLRLMESILKDILDICPDAWYVLVANPVLAGVTYMKRKYPQAKIVGMCHGVHGVYSLSQAMGLEKEHVTFEAPGVNHFLWLTKFLYKGEDAFPLLDSWIASKGEAYWQNCGMSGHEGPKQVDLYRRLGAFPIGDTATVGGGTWGWWYHTDDTTQTHWREDPDKWYDWYFSSGLDIVKKIRETAENPMVKVSEVFPGHSNESILPLIEALACDVERVVIVNIMNEGGLVPGVPENFQVEVPALVSAKGIQGIRTAGLPKPVLFWLLRDRVAPVEMELEAFTRGDKELLLSVILMDPWTRNETQAQAMLNTILDMPLNREMKEYYK
jgi:alpha-galactosidase